MAGNHSKNFETINGINQAKSAMATPEKKGDLSNLESSYQASNNDNQQILAQEA